MILTNFFIPNKLKSVWKQSSKVVFLGITGVILASCSLPPKHPLNATILPSVPYIPGTEHISFEQNQTNLQKINGLTLKGQVGVINTKNRYSAVFTFKQDKSGDYRLDLSTPYSADQVSVIKYGNLYFYVQDGKAYTANTLSDFSNALFGFYVPLNLMKEILLGIQINNFEIIGNKNPNLMIENNVIKKEIFNATENITYSGYSFIDNKYIVPKQISIVHDKDRLKIRIFDPYTYTEGVSYNSYAAVKDNSLSLKDVDIKHAIKGKPPQINATPAKATPAKAKVKPKAKSNYKVKH